MTIHMCIHRRPKHILARVMLDSAFSSLVTSNNHVMTRTSIVYALPQLLLLVFWIFHFLLNLLERTPVIRAGVGRFSVDRNPCSYSVCRSVFKSERVRLNVFGRTDQFIRALNLNICLVYLQLNKFGVCVRLERLFVFGERCSAPALSVIASNAAIVKLMGVPTDVLTLSRPTGEAMAMLSSFPSDALMLTKPMSFLDFCFLFVYYGFEILCFFIGCAILTVVSLFLLGWIVKHTHSKVLMRHPKFFGYCGMHHYVLLGATLVSILALLLLLVAYLFLLVCIWKWANPIQCMARVNYGLAWCFGTWSFKKKGCILLCRRAQKQVDTLFHWARGYTCKLQRTTWTPLKMVCVVGLIKHVRLLGIFRMIVIFVYRADFLFLDHIFPENVCL